MQSVPAPHLLARRAPLLLAALVVLALVVALSRIDTTSLPAPRDTSLIDGVQLQSARCVNWNAGSTAERADVLKALTYSVGGATPYGNGTTLASARANSLFDNACSSRIAQHWLLYEIYIRAAGFSSYAKP